MLGGVYQPEPDLGAALRQWVESTFPGPPPLLAGVDTSKWAFIALPARPNTEPWSDQEVELTVADYMDSFGQS